ncbi:MAG: hypothetical protein IPM82_00455 [Saprospiraceae bacterium]|nr:hypothetical protein [Saprospiraceae bacterium]
MEILDNIGEGIELPKDDRIIRKLKTDAMDAQDDLRLGRIALLGLIIFTVLSIAFQLYNGFSLFEILLQNGILLLVFGWAFYYSEKNPRLAFLVAGIVYLLVVLLAAVVVPGSLFRGIIFKLIIVFFLVKGIISSSKFEEIRSQLKAYGEDLKIRGIMDKKY